VVSNSNLDIMHVASYLILP